jgi:hypothetical protein
MPSRQAWHHARAIRRRSRPARTRCRSPSSTRASSSTPKPLAMPHRSSATSPCLRARGIQPGRPRAMCRSRGRAHWRGHLAMRLESAGPKPQASTRSPTPMLNALSVLRPISRARVSTARFAETGVHSPGAARFRRDRSEDGDQFDICWSTAATAVASARSIAGTSALRGHDGSAPRSACPSWRRWCGSPSDRAHRVNQSIDVFDIASPVRAAVRPTAPNRRGCAPRRRPRLRPCLRPPHTSTCAPCAMQLAQALRIVDQPDPARRPCWMRARTPSSANAGADRSTAVAAVPRW